MLIISFAIIYTMPIGQAGIANIRMATNFNIFQTNSSSQSNSPTSTIAFGTNDACESRCEHLDITWSFSFETVFIWMPPSRKTAMEYDQFHPFLSMAEMMRLGVAPLSAGDLNSKPKN
jgi:hypothetical protein